jgi:hypothetical protein
VIARLQLKTIIGAACGLSPADFAQAGQDRRLCQFKRGDTKLASAGMEIHLTGVTNVTSSDFIPIIKTGGNSAVYPFRHNDLH